jgi:hypothetical protein
MAREVPGTWKKRWQRFRGGRRASEMMEACQAEECPCLIDSQFGSQSVINCQASKDGKSFIKGAKGFPELEVVFDDFFKAMTKWHKRSSGAFIGMRMASMMKVA